MAAEHRLRKKEVITGAFDPPYTQLLALPANLTALAYLISAVLFILALRGLSSPVTSRQGNLFGMIGMGVAVIATALGARWPVRR